MSETYKCIECGKVTDIPMLQLLSKDDSALPLCVCSWRCLASYSRKQGVEASDE